MTCMVRVHFSVLLTLVASSAAKRPAHKPSPHFVGVKLTALGHASTNDVAAIVLDAPQPQQAAQTSCQTLGENLWAPGSSRTELPLAYLGYTDPSSKDLLYWIGGSADPDCLALSQNGSLAKISCDTKLPALCTQSAQLSTVNQTDTSARWQTAITTGNQTITGYRDKLSFRFLGVRYASQPQRFTYSTVYNDTGSVSALDYSPMCLQSDCISIPSSTCSEDCLFLNVWTPYLPTSPSSQEAAKKLKPVMFWIHGGAFKTGTGSDPTFDGGNMASRGDVVVVAINYRLLTFGFLALDDGETNGNFGIADQITALDWVRANIHAFGGDPQHITIFGQSAGADSVKALLESPKAIGKFQAAIPMSALTGEGFARHDTQYFTIAEEMEQRANAILKETGCANATSRLDCLRKYDATELTSLNAHVSNPVVDGTYITSPGLLSGTGPIAHVPVMIGTMRDDAAGTISYPDSDSSTTDLAAFLASSGLYNASYASSVASSGAFPIPSSLYPTNASLALFNTTTRISTDSEFRCLDYAIAYTGVRDSLFPSVHYYEFNRSYQLTDFDPNAPVCRPPSSSVRPAGDPEEEYFKCHSGELYYVFGNVARQELPSRDEGDIPFSQLVLDSWTAFARTGDPNPAKRFLQARGFTSTLDVLGRAGMWAQVSAQEPTYWNFQWPLPENVPFEEKKQCETLGLGLGYYG